ncbi:MAG: hypothetical protein WEA04_04915 [Candidatus Andersenbacteria bacterium]
MRHSLRVVWALAGIIILLLLLLMILQVGGIAIRGVGGPADAITFTLSEPLLRGVPLTLQWQGGATDAAYEVLILWYDDEGDEVMVGKAGINEQRARVVLPCTTVGDTGTLALVNRETQEIVARESLTLLPAGAECLLR